MIDTTIKSFCNHAGYSDSHPYEVVRIISNKTVEIREMKAERDQTFRPEFVAGGFAGYCTNQSEQRWIYSKDESAPVLRCRLGKRGWKSSRGQHSMDDAPFRFYDYNF